ncbi:MAG: hypothetical protein ACR2FV_12360 [Ornithinimicrobium sp.]|uniref:hypothetical protein n=1 Tax=Ornithinimicrobium sp. TaxID=1977084 RepID=UPI003D9B444F
MQASYDGPDLQRYSAPYTFDTRLDAEEWLAAERRLRTSNTWTPPKERQRATKAEVTLADYAPGAVDRRRVRGEPLRRVPTKSVVDAVTCGFVGMLSVCRV